MLNHPFTPLLLLLPLPPSPPPLGVPYWIFGFSLVTFSNFPIKTKLLNTHRDLVIEYMCLVEDEPKTNV